MPLRQRGMASLIVVMVLFFIVSLVAAYTNRNLVFEQRTSANNLRSTQALENAQAGLEWAIAQLNAGRIADDCTASTSAGDASFRERYLNIDVTSGDVTPLNWPSDPTRRRSAACSYTDGGWICDCPVDADPVPAMPVGVTAQQSYRVWFSTPDTTRPGMLRVDVLACPRWDADCLDPASTKGAEGRGHIATLVSLFPAIKSTPASALTSLGTANGSAATVAAYNDNVEVGGVAVAASGPVTGISTSGVAGSPQELSVMPNDPSLSGLAAAPPVITSTPDRLFANTFGVLPADYRQQPGVVRLSSCPCNATTLRDTISLNPGRPIWVEGDLTLDGAVGSASAPVMVVVAGNVTATSATTFYGALYLRSSAPPATGTWSMSGSADFFGATITEPDFVASGAGAVNFLYDINVVHTLQRTTGTWVVLPGSWKDYQ